MTKTEKMIIIKILIVLLGKMKRLNTILKDKIDQDASFEEFCCDGFEDGPVLFVSPQILASYPEIEVLYNKSDRSQEEDDILRNLIAQAEGIL